MFAQAVKPNTDLKKHRQRVLHLCAEMDNLAQYFLIDFQTCFQVR